MGRKRDEDRNCAERWRHLGEPAHGFSWCDGDCFRGRFDCKGQHWRRKGYECAILQQRAAQASSAGATAAAAAAVTSRSTRQTAHKEPSKAISSFLTSPQATPREAGPANRFSPENTGALHHQLRPPGLLAERRVKTSGSTPQTSQGQRGLSAEALVQMDLARFGEARGAGPAPDLISSGRGVVRGKYADKKPATRRKAAAAASIVIPAAAAAVMPDEDPGTAVSLGLLGVAKDSMCWHYSWAVWGFASTQRSFTSCYII